MSSASQPANSAIIGSPIAIRNPNRRSPCRQRRRQWRRSVTSPVRSDSISTNSMIAPISANSPPKRIPAATSATMSVITSTGRLNGSSPFETSPGGVDVLNCAVGKLTPLPTKNTTSASFSQRRILIGVRNSR